LKKQYTMLISGADERKAFEYDKAIEEGIYSGYFVKDVITFTGSNFNMYIIIFEKNVVS